ncbi:epoxide hydrolase [Sistotremastrum niveocremeum HHB9708]|uniref:Epoxide hydrolase n=1 Tax=Sistotremastrum niveocremeum HHB9708 TaxID=1314777 RepID=A0A165AK61_9AGAM|nr:epoxide hydrolase [Sistotremastrum niveocremeum HHB9708]
MSGHNIHAVIFDIGGVVLRSPLIAIAEYEAELGLPKDYLNVMITRGGANSAWQRFERGELSLLPFYAAFGRDLSDLNNGNTWYRQHCFRKQLACPPLPTTLCVNGRELFGRMMRTGSYYEPDVVEAIRRIRESGKFIAIALTNNFGKLEWRESDAVGPYAGLSRESEYRFLGWDAEGSPTPQRLRDMFDDFIDSSIVGMRKPDPDIYLHACERNGIHPEHAVFLDDLGMNLKTAKQLGMATIQVRIGKTQEALCELSRMLGIDLLAERSSKL